MLALYIHVPFCLSKCRYCAFNSRPLPGRGLPAQASLVDDYLAALCRELQLAAAALRCGASPGESLRSIYFGGGTPTLLDPSCLCSLLEQSRLYFNWGEAIEITVEANPATVNRSGLAELRWPARVELLARRPAVVVDSAHNLSSIDALLQALAESFSVRRRLLVFATTREKDAQGMLARLLGRFDHAVFTRYLNNPRAVPPEVLQAVAAELTGRRYPACPDPAAAWEHMRALAAPEDLVCVTGSFFIAAEMRSQIQARLEADAEDRGIGIRSDQR